MAAPVPRNRKPSKAGGMRSGDGSGRMSLWTASPYWHDGVSIDVRWNDRTPA